MPAIRGEKSKSKTRRRKRDLDQVHADLHDAKHLSQYKDTKAAEDLPGLGEHYCVECAKWFEQEANLVAHKKAKPHKRRVRQLKDEPYSQREAEAAIGLRTDNGRTTRSNAQDVDMDVQDPHLAFVKPIQPLATTAMAIDEDDGEEYDAFFSTYNGTAVKTG